MNEPRTEAGREMLELVVNSIPNIHQPDAIAAILAIEAEAADAARRASDAQMAGLERLAARWEQTIDTIKAEGEDDPALTKTTRIQAASRQACLDDLRALMAAAPAPQPATRFAPPQNEVDRTAQLLIREWERIESPVTASYVATFVDLARAVVAAAPQPAPLDAERLSTAIARVRMAQNYRPLRSEDAEALAAEYAALAGPPSTKGVPRER